MIDSAAMGVLRNSGHWLLVICLLAVLLRMGDWHTDVCLTGDPHCTTDTHSALLDHPHLDAHSHDGALDPGAACSNQCVDSEVEIGGSLMGKLSDVELPLVFLAVAFLWAVVAPVTRRIPPESIHFPYWRPDEGTPPVRGPPLTL